MTVIPGAVYCRISDDAEGQALGVQRQREDCLAVAAQHDIEVKPEHVLIENDVGASARSKKKRPEYDRLRELVVSGTVKAVVFYSNSRLTRRPMELEDWITLHEKTGVRFYSKVSGNDDLSTADGRMVARIKGSVDAAEAERISERVARANQARREKGIIATGGVRAFGFSDSGNTPALVPEEADAIRRGADILLAGGSFADVARDWTKRGVKPVRVKNWTRDNVRAVYRSGRIAGLVTYKGEIVGEANVEPILDRATWEAVTEATTRRAGAPVGSEHGARKHVLSGFLYCGRCGAKLVTQPDDYRCLRSRQGCGGLKRNKAWLDAFVDGYVRGKLAQSEAVEAPQQESGVREEVAKMEAQIAEARQRHIDGALDAEDFFPLLSGLRRKLNDLRKREAAEAREATQSAALHDPLKVWESGELHERRALLAGLTKGIYVKPVGRIGRAPIPVDSVDIL